MRIANVSQRDHFIFISMDLKNPIRYEYSQSTNASLCKKLTNNFWWEAEAVIQKWSEKRYSSQKT